MITLIVLGVVQALTEFLPISSSAHLKLIKHFIGSSALTDSVMVDLACHFGTLFALIFFLRKDILELFSLQKIYLFFLALIPLVPSYFLLKPLRELLSTMQFLGPCMICTGLILMAGQFLRLKSATSEKKQVFMIGLMQSAALVPGISRSGSTIACARILGWEPKKAVRFSFLLSIPTIIGGNCIELIRGMNDSFPTITLSYFSILFLFSFIIGTLVIRKAIGFLEKGNLKPFGWYCIFLGICVTFYFNL